MRSATRCVDATGTEPRPFERQRPSAHTRGQSLALEQLHHEKLPLDVLTMVTMAADGRTADVVEHADVWVRQPRNRPSFALETFAVIGICGELGEEHLDRYAAVQPRVAGAIDLAHAAGTQC